MTVKKVVIEVLPDGSTSIDAQGFQGSSCALATKELELVLAGSGGEVSDKKKPDFYNTRSTTQTQRN